MHDQRRSHNLWENIADALRRWRLAQPYNSENTEEAKLKLRQESQETWPRTEHAHTELLELKHMHMPHVYGPKGNTTETQAINKGNEQTERLCTE